jgi:hypothetical protein
MDIPVLFYALVGMGLYCHYLLNKISHLNEQNASLSEMIASMAEELQKLGSPNVFICNKETSTEAGPPR